MFLRVPFVRYLSASNLSPSPESLDDSCKWVADSQPHVLIIPEALSAWNFTEWSGTVVNTLGKASSSAPDILPFVGRLSTLTSMARALAENNKRAEMIQRGQSKMVRSLRLVGSGALYGAGKTTLSPVLHQCLQRVFEPNQKVLLCVVDDLDTVDSPYALWMKVLAQVPALKGLQRRFVETTPWPAMIGETAKRLLKRRCCCSCTWTSSFRSARQVL
jgi:hypothetical protein